MIPIDFQVSRFKVKGQPILDMLGKGGISVSQTSIFEYSFDIRLVIVDFGHKSSQQPKLSSKEKQK